MRFELVSPAASPILRVISNFLYALVHSSTKTMGAALHIRQVNCPYCAANWKSVDPYGWIKRHVAEKHPENLEAFQQLPRSEYSEMVLTKAGIKKLKKEELHQKRMEEKRMKEQDENPSNAEPAAEQNAPADDVKPKPVVVTPPPARVQPAVIRAPAAKQQTPVEQPPAKIQMPFDQPLEPGDWLEAFLMQFDLTQKFLTFQRQKHNITHQLPHPKELLADLNDLDSGSKLKRQNELIVYFYEHALADYQRQLQSLNMPYEHLAPTFHAVQTTPPGFEQPARQSYQSPTMFPRSEPSPFEQNELREMKEEIRRLQQEKERQTQDRIRDLESKLEQQKNMPMQSPIQETYQHELKVKLEQMEMETKRLQTQLNEQAQQNLLNKLAEVERRAAQTPSMENIHQLVQQLIEQDRTVKIRPEELEQRIKELVNKEKAGITPEAVQMSQIEKTYELDKLKLQADQDKTGMWGDTIKSIAAIFGESLGKGLATAGQPTMPQQPPANPHMPPTGPLEEPSEPEEPSVKTCPKCNKSMIFTLPPGVTVGQCPYCSTPLELTPSGDLQVFDVTPLTRPTEPTQNAPVQQEPEPEPEKTNGSSIGKCAQCNRTLYYFNIARTDKDGKMWCKRCAEAQQDGLR